jgi:hypothetical protein
VLVAASATASCSLERARSPGDDDAESKKPTAAVVYLDNFTLE